MKDLHVKLLEWIEDLIDMKVALQDFQNGEAVEAGDVFTRLGL